MISLGGLSEKAMKRMYTEYPHIHSIDSCVWIMMSLEMRDAGSLFLFIPEELSVYRLEPVKKDWNECLVAEIPVENMAKQMCWRDAREKPVPVMKMSEVEETVPLAVMVSVHSLWKGYFLSRGIREKEKRGLQWQSPHTVQMEKNFPTHFP